MANKDRNKRSARQARQRERAEHEALVAESTPAKDNKKKVTTSQAAKTPANTSAEKNKGLISRTKTYLMEVRAEMRRVTWPSKTELTNYSVAVIAMLIVFGTAVWLVDTGFVALLVTYTGLRG